MKASKLINKAKLAIVVGTVGTASLLSATANAENVELNWALWNYNSEPYYSQIISAYEAKHPDVKIKYTDLGSADYPQMLTTQLTGGADDLDILTIKDVPLYATLISKGSMTNLNDFVKKENIDTKAYSGLVDSITVDGNLYAMPYRSDFWLVYYNKDIFDKAGVKYPTNDMTTEAYDALATKVTSGFGAKKIYGSVFHTWRSTVQLNGILDGKHTLADGNYDFLIPSYQRAVTLQDKKVVPSYGFLKTTKTHYSGPFFNSTLAMLPMGSWFIGSQIAKVKSGESNASNWGLVKYPHPKGVQAGTTASTITSLAVNSKSKHQKASMDFIKFVSGPEGAAIIAQSGIFPALRTETVIDTIVAKEGFPKDPQSREALKTVQTYLEMPVNLKAAQIELVLNRAHDEIMTENISIKEGIKDMNEGVSKILAE